MAVGVRGLLPIAQIGGALITFSVIRTRMPKTLEIVCNENDCDLDMFELHYEYSMPDGTGVEAFNCPYCGESDELEELHP